MENLTNAQKIVSKEIAKGLEVIERYGSKKPELIAKNRIQERIDFLKSLTGEEIEKSEHFLECSVSGQINNFERLKDMLKK